MKVNYLKNRHIGLSEEDRNAMLQEVGVKSIEELIEQTMPKDILLQK